MLNLIELHITIAFLTRQLLSPIPHSTVCRPRVSS